MVILGGIVALVLWVLLLGRFYPGNGLDQLGLRSAREITETREELEAEDLQQMLAAHNARRRARGEREISEEELEGRLAGERAEQEQRRAALAEEGELDQLLEATNARRRARGLPERTRQSVEREFGSTQQPSGPSESREP